MQVTWFENGGGQKHIATYKKIYTNWQVALVAKNLPANAGDLGSTTRLGRSSGERNGYALQYS